MATQQALTMRRFKGLSGGQAWRLILSRKREREDHRNRSMSAIAAAGFRSFAAAMKKT